MRYLALGLAVTSTLLACGTERRIGGPVVAGPRDGGGSESADAGPALDGGGGRDAGAATTDAGGTADGGRGRDAGSARDGGEGGAGPCAPPMNYERVGQTWSWSTTAASEAETGVATVLDHQLIALDDRGDHHRVRMAWTQQQVGANFTQSLTGEIEYRCDADGVWITRQEYDSTLVSQGTTTTTQVTTQYTPPLQLMTADPRAGDVFSGQSTSVVSGTSSTGGPFESTTELAHTTRVLPATSVTVPAGTFFAIGLSADYGNGPQVSRYAEGTGWVASGGFELDTYQ